MNRLKMSVVAVSALVAGALPLVAQTVRQGGGPSPHETINAKIGGQRGPMVMVVYGRPYAKAAVNNVPNTGAKRKVWGELVPYGKVWRAGSDEATLFITQQPLTFGTVEVPAGAYTLAMQPEADGTAKLIINKQIGQWGIPYNGEKTELGRIAMKKDAVDKEVEQFTIAIESKGTDTGVLKMIWENTQYSVEFKLKK